MAKHVGVFVYVRVLHSMLCAVWVIGSYHGFDGGWSCDHFSLQPPMRVLEALPLIYSYLLSNSISIPRFQSTAIYGQNPLGRIIHAERRLVNLCVHSDGSGWSFCENSCAMAIVNLAVNFVRKEDVVNT